MDQWLEVGTQVELQQVKWLRGWEDLQGKLFITLHWKSSMIFWLQTFIHPIYSGFTSFIPLRQIILLLITNGFYYLSSHITSQTVLYSYKEIKNQALQNEAICRILRLTLELILRREKNTKREKREGRGIRERKRGIFV